MNSQSKGLSMLGLAMKAGKVSSGEFATEQAVKSGSAYLVILAETASALSLIHISEPTRPY